MRQKNEFIVNYFTYMVILYPFLSMYRFFNTLINWGDVASIFFIILLLLKRKKIKINGLFLIIVMYSLLQGLIITIIDSSAILVDLYGTLFRLLIIWYMILYFRDYFNQEKGIRLIISVSIISSIYLVIQYLLSSKGIYLGGGIPGLEPYKSNITNYVDDVIKYNITYRARSFFEEPAHFAQYLNIPIILLLCKENKSFKDVCTLCFLIVAVIMSMSMIGIVSLLLIVLFWLLFNKNKTRNSTLIMLIIIFVFIGFCIYSPYVRYVFVSKFINKNILSDGRFSAITSGFSGNNIISLVFGKGLMDSNIYYSGIFRIVLSFGVIGLVCAFYIFIRQYRKYKKDLKTRIILLLILFLSIGSELIFGKFILLYLAFCNFENKQIN